MKKAFATLTLAALAMTLGACGGSKPPADKKTEAPKNKGGKEKPHENPWAIETPGTGIVVPEPDAKLVKDAIEKFFGQEPSEDFVKNIQRENERLSWSNFCSKLLDFYQTL